MCATHESSLAHFEINRITGHRNCSPWEVMYPHVTTASTYRHPPSIVAMIPLRLCVPEDQRWASWYARRGPIGMAYESVCTYILKQRAEYLTLDESKTLLCIGGSTWSLCNPSCSSSVFGVSGISLLACLIQDFRASCGPSVAVTAAASAM